MPKDCESLRLSLRLECTRLLDWADLAGLSDHNNHPKFDWKLKANRATIMALLSEMKTLIDRLRKISLRSDDVLLASGDEAVAQTTTTAKQLNLANRREELKDTDMEQLLSVLELSDEESRSEKKHLLTRGLKRVVDIGRGVVDVAKQPGRIRWVLSDHEAFKTQVARLKELTDYLHETLGDHQMSILIEQTKETCMAMLQMTNSMGEMKELVQAVEIATSRRGIESEIRHWLPLGDAVVVVSEHPQTLFAQLTRFRYSIAKLEAQPDDGESKLKSLKLEVKPNEQQPENLSLDYTRTTETSDYRVPATYMGGAAWVEWKPYRSVRYEYEDTPGKFYYGPTKLVTSNLERLVAILHMDDRPTQFRVPLCAGYYVDEDNQRFGLIYRVNGTAPRAAESEITSLSQLLLLQDKPPPPLQSRISLATELATSLYFLHAVNWLHKGLRDESVLVLMRGGIPDYTQPYISDFEYSRPDEQDLTSTAASEAWAVYTHPDYLGVDKVRYRKTFDMYSMGIILLEIALWKPADEILGFKQPPKPTGCPSETTRGTNEPPAKKSYSKESLQDLKYVRKRLLTDEPALLEHVAAIMGSRYRDAVRACIGGLEDVQFRTEVDESREVIATVLQQAYLRLVVDVLRGIKV
ncbi:prion-inhibition and propagation-domain-containing protein [Ilyonectria sp. MPI-CAGE-AT-0026]|nr:prion-inhibition and propagation-domain-containing protein [Ilyonectria sp. MPI-CAGE-AT-0026]